MPGRQSDRLDPIALVGRSMANVPVALQSKRLSDIFRCMLQVSIGPFAAGRRFRESAEPLMSTFRLKLFALWLTGFAVSLFLRSGLPTVYEYPAFAFFMVLVVAQFYVRCESCESSLVNYFVDPRQEWLKPTNFVSAVLSDECPKCGARRI